MKTFKQYITEETRQFIQKMVDPALLTLKQYMNVVNPSDKHHPEAYDLSVDEMNSNRGISTDPKDWPKLINQFTIHNIQFEMREKSSDRWQGQYTKTDAEGNVVRDEKGGHMLMSLEDLQQLFPDDKRFEYEHAIFDVSNKKMVANTQDEWGCLLVMVAREYRNFGLGTKLVKYHREIRPTRDSGGLTNAGFHNVMRVHTAHVRDYLSSGMYSHLVKTGKLTAAQVKDIVTSANLDSKPAHKQLDLDVSNTANWLLLADASRAILYHKGFYQFDHDAAGNESGYWTERFILGYATIGGGDIPFIFSLYGVNPKIESFMLELMLNTEVGGKIALDEKERGLLTRLGDKLRTEPYQRSPRPRNNEELCWVDQPTMNWKAMTAQERLVRRQHDKYDEYLNRLEELADSVGRSS